MSIQVFPLKYFQSLLGITQPLPLSDVIAGRLQFNEPRLGGCQGGLHTTPHAVGIEFEDRFVIELEPLLIVHFANA
jgi:hypothetical protein